MKKRVVGLLVACFLLLAAWGVFHQIRAWRYQAGREQGHAAGYSYGYEDENAGEDRNFQMIANEANPFSLGNAKWKGFMRGFHEGYAAGKVAARQSE